MALIEEQSLEVFIRPIERASQNVKSDSHAAFWESGLPVRAGQRSERKREKEKYTCGANTKKNILKPWLSRLVLSHSTSRWRSRSRPIHPPAIIELLHNNVSHLL